MQDADQAMRELFGPLLGKRNTPAEDAAKESQTERPSKAGRQNDGGKGRGHNRRLVARALLHLLRPSTRFGSAPAGSGGYAFRSRSGRESTGENRLC